MTLDRLCVADVQTLLEKEPYFSSGNQQSLYAGHSTTGIIYQRVLKDLPFI